MKLFLKYRERRALGLSRIEVEDENIKLIHKRWDSNTGEVEDERVITMKRVDLTQERASLETRLERLIEVISEIDLIKQNQRSARDIQ